MPVSQDEQTSIQARARDPYVHHLVDADAIAGADTRATPCETMGDGGDLATRRGS